MLGGNKPNTYEKVNTARKDASHIEAIKRNILGSNKMNYTYDRLAKEEGKLESPHLKAPTWQRDQNINPLISNPYCRCS